MSVKLRSGLVGALAGMVWGVLVFAGGLILASQVAPPPATADAAGDGGPEIVARGR